MKQFELIAKTITELIEGKEIRGEEIEATIVLHLKNCYNEGMKNGWFLANNNIKEQLRPWFKGVHNVKIELIK